MIERTGDLWAYPAAWICIPTNGMRRKGDGSAVMGAGLAKTAAELCPELPAHLGKLLLAHGNHVLNLGLWDVNGREIHLVSFPTKEHWNRPSHLDLIRRSARELRADFSRVEGAIAMPRVGCGFGGLGWSVVQPVLHEELPGDQFVVVTP